ncbi:hypothetical protein DSM3645_28007 [Blastopirellula marina DSM 3645]|uniref:Uncharacterized protein n=1 Tax=Blastopirellula marina DSM 3645 TaxID=314230 RepID=A3ZP27_9BACT|nr:hypothetical protein DSM3645_28007 [Blastopirellula marina DSM 3645]
MQVRVNAADFGSACLCPQKAAWGGLNRKDKEIIMPTILDLPLSDSTDFLDWNPDEIRDLVGPPASRLDDECFDDATYGDRFA